MNLLTALTFLFLPTDTLASFPGGDVVFDTFIKQNLKTTQAAIDAKITGEVLLKFTIDEKGNAGQFVVQKSLGYGCDEEAIAVLQSMPPWQPMVINNRRVKATFTQKFVFTPDLKVSSRKAPRASVPNARSSYGDSDKSLQQFITENFVYPSRKSQEGTVVVKFKVTSKGVTSDITIVTGIDPAIDNEVIRVLNKLGNWNPKRINMNPVDEYRTLVLSVRKKKLSVQQLQ